MEQEKILSWQTQESGTSTKNGAWYWTVGIIGFGAAVASFILASILFGILIIVGTCAVMLAGSRPAVNQKCGISERGVHVGTNLIPFENISHFAISENEPHLLTLKTKSLLGVVSLSLEGVDFRAVRSELKNRNIEEVDELHSLGEKIASMIGM